MGNIIIEIKKQTLFDREFKFGSIENAKSAVEKAKKRSKIGFIAFCLGIFAFILLLIIEKFHLDAENLNIWNGTWLVAMIASIVTMFISTGTSIFRYTKRVYKIVSSKFLFLPGKLLFGFFSAYAFFAIYFINPILHFVMTLYQTKLIKRAAEEFIANPEKDIVEV